MEIIETLTCNEFTTINYWKGRDESLLMNIPTLLDQLYMSDCIQEYDMKPPYTWGTDVCLRWKEKPMGPEHDEQEKEEWVSLAFYMSSIFNDDLALQLVKHYEDRRTSDKVINRYFPHLNKAI